MLGFLAPFRRVGFLGEGLVHLEMQIGYEVSADLNIRTTKFIRNSTETT